MNAQEIFGFRTQVKRDISLGYQMLGPQNRHWVIDTLKDPLRKAIGELSRKGSGPRHTFRRLRAIWRILRVCQLYPVPTRENCRKRNSIVLLDIKDWFFEHVLFSGWEIRIFMFEGVWNMGINVYEHAGEYAAIFDELVEKIVEVHNSGVWQKGHTKKKFWR